VVVVSLPSAVSPAPPAPAANPWSEIESTEVDVAAPRTARIPRQTRETDEPRRRRSRDDDYDDKPRSLKWLWISGGTVATLLLVGLIVMAISAVTPKSKTTEPTAAQNKEQPKPPPEPKPKPESDRAAAEALISMAKLRVRTDAREVEVSAAAALPTGRLTVLEIDFEGNALNMHFVNNTFIPALTNLKSLTEVRLDRWQLELSPDHVRQMAAMPLAKTLQRLDARVELTPASLTELKKFEVLNDITLSVPHPDDALFERLVELPRVDTLAFHSLSPSPNLTSKGWEAVAKLPLTTLTLVRSRAAPDAFRALTAKGVFARGAPTLEFVGCEDLGDAALLDLSKRETDLKTLTLRGIDVTNKGVLHLAAVKSLKTLILRQTKVTEAGAKALITAHGDLNVILDGTILRPTK
jgi:hypothetical protein